MHIFDSHAHYDDPAFGEDRHRLLSDLHRQGVDFITNIGCDAKTCETSVALAEQYDFIYAAVGWHPEFAGSWNAEAETLLRRLARHPKVRAIGETGVDYHWMCDPAEVQLACFDAQLSIAEEVGLPVVIHQREGTEDCLSVVRRHPGVTGVFHCYSGSAETARELLDRGFYLGFTGVITFKNARKSHEVLRMMPRSRILIETDCPYMAPEPFRGRRCDPSLVPYVAKKIADLRGIPAEEVARATESNARRVFRL